MCRNCALPASLEACPRQAVFKEGRRVVLDADRCVGCGLCVRACAFSVTRIEALTKADGLSRKLGSRAKCAVKCDGCKA